MRKYYLNQQWGLASTAKQIWRTSRTALPRTSSPSPCLRCTPSWWACIRHHLRHAEVAAGLLARPAVRPPAQPGDAPLEQNIRWPHGRQRRRPDQQQKFHIDSSYPRPSLVPSPVLPHRVLLGITGQLFGGRSGSTGRQCVDLCAANSDNIPGLPRCSSCAAALVSAPHAGPVGFAGTHRSTSTGWDLNPENALTWLQAGTPCTSKRLIKSVNHAARLFYPHPI